MKWTKKCDLIMMRTKDDDAIHPRYHTLSSSYIYIYIYRERERERERDGQLQIVLEVAVLVRLT